MTKAILFDLNGTMIDDMEYHLEAWFDILTNNLKANLSRQQVKKEMYGKNEELLVRVFGDKKFTDEKMKDISLEKERKYQKAFLPHLKLIDGLDEFLKTASARQIKMGIASAAIMPNIDFVVDNLQIRNFFGSIVSADDVTTSKPHPETFLKAAAFLRTDPADCIVFEDAPKGVEAALNAKMPVIVLTTTHDKADFDKYPGIVAFIKDYNDSVLLQLFQA